MTPRILSQSAAGLSAAALLIMTVPFAQAQESLEVTVVDNAEKLSAEDEQWLISDTPSIEFPVEVKAVRYLTIRGGTDNINDDVENLLRSDYPDWIQSNSFSPGEVIIAVGFDPNTMGAYAGNDVASVTGIAKQERIDGINDSMRQLLRDDRIALAMQEGASSVADSTVVREESSGASGWLIGGILSGIVALIAAIFGGIFAIDRNQKLKKAREQFDYSQKHYGNLAQELDGINVKAHSLTSPLANDALREQWENIHSRFLKVNQSFSDFGDLSATSKNKEFLSQRKLIDEVHTTVTEMETAQENIDTLSEMEHGDAAARRRELKELRADIQEARIEVDDKDSVLDDTLVELIDRIEKIHIESPDFMDTFAGLLEDYGVALASVKKQLAEVEQSTEHTTPTIYDSNWRVGTGYNSFVPFYVINSWHAADVSAAASSSNSSYSSNTSFSSGFSGAGGGSKW